MNELRILMDRLAEMDRTNGEHITVDGKSYFFKQQPYCTNAANGEAVYEAIMVSDSGPIVDGCVDAYEVQWEIVPDWDGEDESNACDWEAPASIRCVGGMDVEDWEVY